MMKVNSFINNARSIFTTKPVHKIVIGNQSADLDSIASAISMSFYLNNLSSDSDTFIPVINSTKTILQSKKECLFLFDFFSINIDELIFISELKHKNISQVILVDHNQLDEQEISMEFESIVTGVIDHHIDSHTFQSADPRIINLNAGSNCTLIAELFYKSKINLDSSFASLLTFPILFDTSNLTVRAGQSDFEMIEFLTEISSLDNNLIYKKLEEIKFAANEDESTETILKKDYKQYLNGDLKWGMSSVNLSVEKLIEKNPENIDQIESYMIDNKLYFFGILSIFKTNELVNFKRDLALFSTSEDLLNAFNHNQNSNLTLLKTCKNKNIFYCTYAVKEVSLTRKYFQPVLEFFLKSN